MAAAFHTTRAHTHARICVEQVCVCVCVCEFRRRSTAAKCCGGGVAATETIMYTRRRPTGAKKRSLCTFVCVCVCVRDGYLYRSKRTYNGTRSSRRKCSRSWLQNARKKANKKKGRKPWRLAGREFLFRLRDYRTNIMSLLSAFPGRFPFPDYRLR